MQVSRLLFVLEIKSRSLTGSHGAALIMVLTGLLSLSVVILGVTEMVARQSANFSLLTLEYRSSITARGALSVGLSLFEDDFLENPEQGLIWSDQGLTITIKPCSSKLNLNSSALSGQGVQRFKNAVASLIEGQDLSMNHVDLLLYWTGAEHDNPAGQTSPGHSAAFINREYSAPGRDLKRPEEILLIPGFEDLAPSWIRSKFTVWGEQGRINLNSSPREVALALIPELTPYWDRLDMLRKQEVITHPNQLLTRAGMDITTYSQILPYLVFDTRYYEMNIEVQHGGWYEKYRYIVRKQGMDQDVDVKVLAVDVVEARPT